MLKTIPIINNKGGVGKTTTAVNVAAGLAHRGCRVLLVDLDSQGSASLSLGVDHDELTPSSAEVLFGQVDIQQAIRSTDVENLELLTGNLELANANAILKRQDRGYYRLEEVLSTVRDYYHVIVVDCAPSTSILSVCALVAADGFLIPVTPHYLSLEGIVSLGGVVRRVRQGIGESAPLLGIVVTKVDPDGEPPADAFGELESHYGRKVFDTHIRLDAKVREAPSHNCDIFRYAPESPAAEDYRDLLDELENRLKRYGTVFGDVAQHPPEHTPNGTSSA